MRVHADSQSFVVLRKRCSQFFKDFLYHVFAKDFLKNINDHLSQILDLSLEGRDNMIPSGACRFIKVLRGPLEEKDRRGGVVFRPPLQKEGKKMNEET